MLLMERQTEMTKSAPAARSCHLPIINVVLNERPAKSFHPAYRMFGPALEVAAIELIDHRLTGLDRMNPTPPLIMLDVDRRSATGSEWSFSVEAFEDDPFSPGITWPQNAAGDRGEVYHAMEYHLRPLIQKMEERNWIDLGSYMIFRCRLGQISSHLRLRLMQTRSEMVTAYKNNKS